MTTQQAHAEKIDRLVDEMMGFDMEFNMTGSASARAKASNRKGQILREQTVWANSKTERFQAAAKASREAEEAALVAEVAAEAAEAEVVARFNEEAPEDALTVTVDEITPEEETKMKKNQTEALELKIDELMDRAEAKEKAKAFGSPYIYDRITAKDVAGAAGVSQGRAMTALRRLVRSGALIEENLGKWVSFHRGDDVKLERVLAKLSTGSIEAAVGALRQRDDADEALAAFEAELARRDDRGLRSPALA